MNELERFVSFRFNYPDEIGPARAGDRAIEVAMLAKLVADPANKWSVKELADALHDYVHVANHYTVVDGPAPDGLMAC